jgi:hypothetical protein
VRKLTSIKTNVVLSPSMDFPGMLLAPGPVEVDPTPTILCG